MVAVNEIQALVGREVVDHTGEAIGTVTEVYIDDWTDAAAWVVVHGPGGDRVVPLAGSRVHGAVLETDLEAGLVRSAPDLATGDAIGPEDEAALLDHYGSASSPTAGPGGSADLPRSAHQSSPTTGPGASGDLPSTTEAASPTTGPGASGDLPVTEPRQSPRTGVGGPGVPRTHLRRWTSA